MGGHLNFAETTSLEEKCVKWKICAQSYILDVLFGRRNICHFKNLNVAILGSFLQNVRER